VNPVAIGERAGVRGLEPIERSQPLTPPLIGVNIKPLPGVVVVLAHHPELS
jgi:hypothetical protein